MACHRRIGSRNDDESLSRTPPPPPPRPTGLQLVLQRALAVGNAMNEGSERGGASSLTLASLEKLASTKVGSLHFRRRDGASD